MDKKVIAKGISASPGITAGIVKVVISIDDLDKVEKGDILCVKMSNPAWTIGMLKSSALIAEIGGVVCHTAIVAREMGIPCIVGVSKITDILRDGMRIKVDANEGIIYEH